MKLTNNTNKGGGDKTLSTQLYSLKLSLFFSVLSSLYVSHAALCVLHTHAKTSQEGGTLIINGSEGESSTMC
jgi:hypothetical protein